MSTEEKKEEGASHEMGFIEHLIELRDRLLRMVIAIAIVFACLFPFASELYSFLSGPLTQHLPAGSSMIAIDVASPFLTPFKLVLMLSVFITVPFLLYQLWSFVAPGLYKHEKRLASPLLVSSVLLFYLGIAFAYYVVFPLVFGFFTSVAPDGVAVMTDINRYLDFVLMLFFAFGIAFEVPIATIILVAIGVTTPEKLGKMRPYVVVAAFVIGMLLTPPDVISQVLLAIPMWILFEFGLIAANILVVKPRERAAAKEAAEEGGSSAPVAAAATAAATSESTAEPKPFEDALVEFYPEDAASTDGEPEDEFAYRPLTDEEMDAELDRLEDEEDELTNEPLDSDQEEDDDDWESDEDWDADDELNKPDPKT